MSRSLPNLLPTLLRTKRLAFFALALVGLGSFTLSACKGLFGSREDEQVDEVFKEGRIDPTLIPAGVGYVPVLPDFTGFNNPTDVYVGFDELMYVVDAQGLHVCDITGQCRKLVPLRGALKVVQDRRLHTYVSARITYRFEGTDYDLPAVYQLSGTGLSGEVVFVDTIIHPFSDPSRANSLTAANLRQDERASFTGLATFADNKLYVARTNPDIINRAPAVLPDNAVLIFNPTGQFLGQAVGLTPRTSSLRSAMGITSLASFVQPPQSLFGVNATKDFLLTQGDSLAETKTLWIKESSNPETGTDYVGNTSLLSFDTSRADGFLYSSFRFKRPMDVTVAPDATGYIFVVDAGTDSLYIFNQRGYEGVNPPATAGSLKQVKVSFGGRGSGPFQFRQPSGVAYFKRTVYVADKGNGRVVRFRLSTDLEQ